MNVNPSIIIGAVFFVAVVAFAGGYMGLAPLAGPTGMVVREGPDTGVLMAEGAQQQQETEGAYSWKCSWASPVCSLDRDESGITCVAEASYSGDDRDMAVHYCNIALDIAAAKAQSQMLNYRIACRDGSGIATCDYLSTPDSVKKKCQVEGDGPPYLAQGIWTNRGNCPSTVR